MLHTLDHKHIHATWMPEGLNYLFAHKSLPFEINTYVILSVLLELTGNCLC